MNVGYPSELEVVPPDLRNERRPRRGWNTFEAPLAIELDPEEAKDLMWKLKAGDVDCEATAMSRLST